MRQLCTVVLALALTAGLVPAASAGGGPFTYPPAPGADHNGVTAAVLLAAACLLLGALTVLPRRPWKGA